MEAYGTKFWSYWNCVHYLSLFSYLEFPHVLNGCWFSQQCITLGLGRISVLLTLFYQDIPLQSVFLRICLVHQGYDISFLITNYHCEDMQKRKLIEFIVQFMEVIFFYFLLASYTLMPRDHINTRLVWQTIIKLSHDIFFFKWLNINLMFSCVWLFAFVNYFSR